MSGAGALFIDRDGTLIEDRNYLGDPDEVALLPGVAKALARARALGYRLYLFTNQSGVGRGYFTLGDVHAVNRRMEELLGLSPPVFDAIGIAPEHPDDPPVYRKPSPRFIFEHIAADNLDPAHCYMIGDSPADWQAALNAQIHPIALTTGPRGDPSDHPLIRENRIHVYSGLPAFVASLQPAPWIGE
ncbi:MAG: HAD-IIIA family hydrolase [Puniceicoccaceae bacterium]|nr:MAG: HAD-IIIA family hydrolase [Puniceicoccaceae bacterium]